MQHSPSNPGPYDLFKELSDELSTDDFALVSNPNYIYQPYDLYLLAPKITTPRSSIKAIVKDMDGTTTTTETLCLHSLEFMLRRLSGLTTCDQWQGLDRHRDYPHIIGNSTTRHVEYLLRTYRDLLNPHHSLSSYIFACLWTLHQGKDPQRRREVAANLNTLGLQGLLDEPHIQQCLTSEHFDEPSVSRLAYALTPTYLPHFSFHDFSTQVRAAIDVYYQRYHFILDRIDAGQSKTLHQELRLTTEEHLIAPMPGVAIFLATLKGWLGKHLSLFFEELSHYLLNHPRLKYTPADFQEARERLSHLGEAFANNPARVGVVTSSILYEADIVLCEVFHLIQEQVQDWPLPAEKKDFVLAQFSSHTQFYDAVITASDSSEIRLKPHRDLYSLALHRLGVTPEEFSLCLGLEDSESGVKAIRAAGIGLCVAVPFADTEEHDLSAASFILHGGLPELLLVHNCFLQTS